MITGFSGKAWMKKFDLGPLSVNGNGPDGRAGTKDDGPFVDLRLHTINPDSYVITGLVKLFKLEKEVEVKISGLSIDLFTRERIFDLYESEVTLVGKPDLKKPEFLAKVALTENYADDLVKYATGFFADATESLTEEVEDAKEALADAEEEVADARKEAAQGIDEFKKKMEKIHDRVEKAEKKVDRLARKIDKAEKAFKKCKWNQIKKKAKLAARLAGLKTSHGTAKTALGTLRKLLDEKNLDKAAEAAKKAADEALKVAEKALDVAKDKATDARKELESTLAFSEKAKDLGQNLTLEEAGFEMSLADLRNAKTPHLYAKLTVYGKRVETNLQFDFKKPEEAFLQLTKAIFTEFAKVDKNLGPAALLLLEAL